MKKSTLFLALAAMAALPMSADVVYSFDPAAPFNNWGKVVEVPETAFVNAREGSVIKINFEILSDEVNEESPAQVQIAVKTVEDWTWTQLVDADEIVGTSYSYTITGACPDDCDDTDLEMIQAHGINLKGQHANVVSIELDNDGAAPEPTVEWTSVWKAGDSPVAFGNWKNIVEVPETAFANAKEGTTMKIVFEGLDAATETSPAQVQLAVKTVADWNWTVLVEADPILGDSYKYEINGACPEGCDDTDLEMLQAHGLNMKGQNATPVEVLLSGEGAGVNSVISDDVNAPVEIFSIDGRRVNEASNGLFIVRQGKSVRKVLVK